MVARFDQLESIIARRTGGSPAQLVLWRRVRDALVATGLSVPTQAQLFEATPHPAALGSFITLLSRSLVNREQEDLAAADRLWQEVAEVIDDTDESLPAWLAAYDVFYRWAEGQGKAPDLNGATGYLHCSAMAVGTSAAYESFPTTVGSMLNTYGYLGEEGACGTRAE